MPPFARSLANSSRYRELLGQIVKRDLLLRYKQTVMGFGWAVFMPLVNTAVFSVIFTRVAPIDTAVPYPLFAFCGFLFWNFFASSLRFSVLSLTSNANLVTKVYFPREIFPFSAVLVCLVDFAGGLARAGRPDGLLRHRADACRPSCRSCCVVPVRVHRGHRPCCWR